MNSPYPKMTDEKLPSLFQKSDSSSLYAQQMAVRLLRVGLGSAILAAFLTSFSTSTDVARVLYIAAACSFMVGAVCSLLMLMIKPEVGWYANRAIAESAKSIAWKYMMGAPPFAQNLPAAEVDRDFCAELQILLASLQPAEGLRKSQWDARPSAQITDEMRIVRSMTFRDRMGVYLDSRLENQRQWYQRKASINGSDAKLWLIGTVAMQFVAVATTFVLAFNPDVIWNPSGLLAATAAGAVGWIQFRKYQELAQSYAIAEQDLALVAAGADHVLSDEDVSRFVADAETAISREHTSWLARRELAAS